MPLWEPAAVPARRRRRTPRCSDCGRRVWSPAALRTRFGLLLGDTCYRRRARAARRLRLLIRVRPPGDIPGQLTIPEQEAPHTH